MDIHDIKIAVITALIVILIIYCFIKYKLILVGQNLAMLGHSSDPLCVTDLSPAACSVITPMNQGDLDAFVAGNHKAMCLAVCKFIAYVGTKNEAFIKIKPDMQYQLISWTKDADPIAIVYNNISSVIVIFRGTLSSADSYEDLQYAQQTQKTDTADPVFVHAGFNTIFIDLINQFDTVLTDASIPVYITGHSLGCALALLLCYHLIIRGFKSVTVVNFAPPRTGNKRFVDVLDAGANITSYINIADIVPTMPPSYIVYFRQVYQFSHPKKMITFNDQRADLLGCHNTLTYYDNANLK